jgi:hypothetical protein
MKDQSNPGKHAELQEEHIEYKMSVIVVRNAVVDPWAMTADVRWNAGKLC